MLSKVIKAFRLANNYTVSDVSNLTGLSAIYISELERGIKKNASKETLFKLANGFNAPPEFIENLLKYSDIIETNYSLLDSFDKSASQKNILILQLLLYKILDYYFNHKLENNSIYKLLVKQYDEVTYSENNITK